MTAVFASPHVGPLPRVNGAHLLLRIGLGGLGVVYIAGGIGLRGASWILPDGLLAGGIALLVMLPWIRGALDALVVIIPFMFYTLSPVGGILTVGTSDSFLPLIAASVFLASLRRGAAGPVRTLRGAGWFMTSSVVLMVGSTVWWTVLSPDFIVSRAISDGLKLGIGFAYLVVVYQLSLLAGLGSTLRAVTLWIWTATLLSCSVVGGALLGIELVPTDGYRSLGYFEDANLFAGYLLVSLSLVLLAAFTRPSLFLLPQALAIVLALVATGSRGGLLSLALLGAFTVVMVNSVRLRLLILGAVLASASVVSYLLSTGRVSGVLGLDRLFFASQEVADDPRTALWARAIEKWLDAPLWGIGLGQFERFSGDVFRVAQSTGLGYVTHNSFLFFLVALGLPGGLLFVGFLVWMTRHVYRGELSLKARHGLAAGLLMISSQMMTLNLQNLRYVWVYFGLALALATLTRRADDGGTQSAGLGVTRTPVQTTLRAQVRQE